MRIPIYSTTLTLHRIKDEAKVEAEKIIQSANEAIRNEKNAAVSEIGVEWCINQSKELKEQLDLLYA